MLIGILCRFKSKRGERCAPLPRRGLLQPCLVMRMLLRGLWYYSGAAFWTVSFADPDLYFHESANQCTTWWTIPIFIMFVIRDHSWPLPSRASWRQCCLGLEKDEKEKIRKPVGLPCMESFLHIFCFKNYVCTNLRFFTLFFYLEEKAVICFLIHHSERRYFTYISCTYFCLESKHLFHSN